MSISRYESELETAQAALRAAHRYLGDEIARYPTPISGCDQQYIRLISDRTRISQALQKLESRPFVATPRILDAGAA